VVDLRARFAWRLPLLVVNAMLGVPEEMHDDFRDAVGLLFATDLSEEEAAAGPVKVYQLLATLIEVKAKRPGDDVTSGLIAAHNSGELSQQELADSLMLLIGAGHETTVNLLDHGVTNLLAHPVQLAMATSGQTGWEQVVEEALRHQAPIASIILRFPTRAVVHEATGLTFDARRRGGSAPAAAPGRRWGTSPRRGRPGRCQCAA
jgi:cytochrome P450